MLVLLLFAFLGGVVTVLSPCILPILPIVLSSGLSGGKRRPLGVVTGFVLSFTFFTVALASIVKATGLSAEALRTGAALIVLLFGLILVIPPLEAWWERTAAKLSSLGGGKNQAEKTGFGGGFLVGLSLGLVWAPCVGPIMASVITLAATGNVGGSTVLVALTYSLGTAIPMFLLIYGGRKVMQVMPALRRNSKRIQQIFGLLMIITAIAIYQQWDRKFQAYVLKAFPQYGAGLTAIEDNPVVQKQLQKLRGKEMDEEGTMDKIKQQLGSLTDYGPAPELEGYTNWVNSERLSIEKLNSQGKVVLVDFWTYSCINCIRTLPYLNDWYQKYADDGLVIIGVHAPEFEFEKSTKNVMGAMEDFGIEYPVVQDNDFRIWRAYSNRYWPAKYLVDVNGRIRYRHFGEGKYQETEMVIQKLLDEAGAQADKELTNIPEYDNETQTPETYLGYERLEGFSSPEGIQEDTETAYTIPGSLDKSRVAYGGTWMVTKQYAAPRSGSELSFRFNAKKVHLVMRPAEEGVPGKVRVLLDGQVVSDAAGDDVKDGTVTVDEDRLYTLISLPQAQDAVLTLEFLDAKVEVYAFTFG